MKINIFITAALISIPCLSGVMALDVSENFSAETRISLSNGDYLFNEINGSIKFEQQVDDNFYGMAKLRFRYYDNPIGDTSFNSTLNLNELGEIYSLQPLEISIDEAYFTYQDFIFQKLDLSAGKERITWGTADKLNPTDILDPNDFSDPFDFGRKIPVMAVNLVYHFSVLESSIQAVFEPYSSVARLNSLMEQDLENTLYSNLVSNISTGVSAFSDSSTDWTSGAVQTPAPDLSNSTIGIKLAGTVLGFDTSVNYVSRINDLPIVNNVNVNMRTDLENFGASTNVTIESRAYTLSYYREQEVGFDFSKDASIFLFWGEMAVTFPGEQKTTTGVSSENYFMGTYVGSTNYSEQSVSISNEAYVKYTIGLDKDLGSGFYINFQYNHGFFNERGNTGPERLQDYFMLRLEKKFLNDKIKIALTGFADINDLADAVNSADFFLYVKDNSGILGLVSISYSPVSDLTVEAGVYGISGPGDTSLGQLADYNMLYMKFDYSF